MTAAALAAACAPIGQPTPTSAPKPAAPAATSAAPAAPAAPAAAQPTAAPKAAALATQAPAAAKAGGVLRIVQASDVAPREPHLRLDVNSPIALTVWDTLVRYDRNVKPQPWVAERWEWSGDNRTLTLKLREGVKFHSGREVTSEDIEFNVTRIREPAVGSQMRGAATLVTRIEKPDRHTISLGFDKPYRAIFDMLDSMAIVDRETVGEAGAGKVIGTGPFMWKEWSPNEKCILEKNPSYWRSGEPLLDRVEIGVVGDVQAMAVQFEAGAQDLAKNTTPQDFTRLRQDPRFRGEVMETGNSYYYVAADVTKEPLDKKEVRQAINHAINRERFVQTVGAGISQATTLPWPKTSPAYDAALDGSIKFDLERSKALLAQAGLASGFEVPITWNTQRPTTNGKLVELLQADLATIGVKLIVQTQENTVFQRTLNEAKFGGLFSHGHGFSNQSPEALFVQAFPFRKQNASNFTFPEYSRLADAMQDEVDEAKLKALYTEMNKLLLDESFIMDVASAPGYYLARQQVQGVDYGLTDWWILNRTSVG